MKTDKVRNLLAGRDNEAEAVAEYRRAIGLDPAAALPHFNLGCSLLAQGNPAACPL